MWHREKSIFAKSIASIILSNVDVNKSAEKFEDMMMEMYPRLRDQKFAESEAKRRYLEASRGKKIYIKEYS